MAIKTISEAGDLRGKKVLIRVDFNVPLRDNEVVDDFRIKKTLETLKYLREKGAKTYILSHIENNHKKAISLRPIHNYLQKFTNGLFFAGGFTELEEISKSLMDGQTVLLENLRFWDGEKANDEKFANRLASFGDIFVNEAFSVSHREHASLVSLPKILPSYVGFLFAEEIKNLSEAFSPSKPFIFILGGAKFETKLPVIEKFMELADKVVIGGALANDFYKASGFEIGDSLVSEKPINSVFFGHEKIMIPEDVVVLAQNGERVVKLANQVLKGEIIKDAGPDFSQKLNSLINDSRFILWNGPLGAFEEGFSGATMELAKNISSSKAKSIIGGGDTLAAIKALGIENYFFVSSGGGAMLDFLAKGTLPGIEALELGN